MEGLVLGLSASTPSSAPTDPAAPTAPDATIAPGPVEETEAASGGERRRMPRLPFMGRAEATEGAAEESAAAVGEAAYGAERLETRDQERSRPEPMTARVVSFDEAGYQRLRVELDNGQVWEQRDAVPPWREEQYGAPDQVEISPSRFGGYRMRLVGSNLALSVERVR
jgi:hypothetical protein